RRSIEITQVLVAGKGVVREDFRNLAAARNNLGDFLVRAKRLTEAEPYLAQAVVGLEKLAAEAPDAIDLQGYLGAALSTKADWLEGLDKLADAKGVREGAIAHEVINTQPQLADAIKKDPDIKRLESRPEFQSILNTLANRVTGSG